jgi:2-oxoglutarate ferredoxin oxidoreductase subunit beta
LKHKGFSYVDVFQPCVTFNYLNTYEWFRKRVYKLEAVAHDVTDKRKALERSLEWGDHIPIGVFYKEERPTYRDNLPHLKGKPLTTISTEDTDITKILQDMT